MIIVGMMKDAGFFEWLITVVLRVKDLTGGKMFAILMIVSAVFSALMGEVAQSAGVAGMVGGQAMDMARPIFWTRAANRLGAARKRIPCRLHRRGWALRLAASRGAMGRVPCVSDQTTRFRFASDARGNEPRRIDHLQLGGGKSGESILNLWRRARV